VYFTGYAISTLGTGDYQPQGAPWLVLTAVASLNGLVMITFIISFIVPVAQDEAFRRTTALEIHHSGATAQELLLGSWDKERRTALASLLADLTPSLVRLEQRHLSTPVLHRFHGSRRPEALELSIAALDEALSIAEHGLDPLEAQLPANFYKARRAITGYLGTLGSAWVRPAAKAPPAPTLDPFRTRGLPVVADDHFAERLRELDERRRLLRALVERSGWSWELVHAVAADADGNAGGEMEGKRGRR